MCVKVSSVWILEERAAVFLNLFSPLTDISHGHKKLFLPALELQRRQHRGLSNELPRETGKWPNYLDIPCTLPLWIWCHLLKGTRYAAPCGVRVSVGTVGWKLGSAPRLSAVRAGQVSEVRAVAVRPNELWTKCIRSLIVSASRGNFYSPSVSLLNRVQVPPPAPSRSDCPGLLNITNNKQSDSSR